MKKQTLTGFEKYAKSTRRAIPLKRKLRIHLLQLWFNLSDPAVEEELYDSATMRRFRGIDLGFEGTLRAAFMAGTSERRETCLT